MQFLRVSLEKGTEQRAQLTVNTHAHFHGCMKNLFQVTEAAISSRQTSKQEGGRTILGDNRFLPPFEGAPVRKKGSQASVRLITPLDHQAYQVAAKVDTGPGPTWPLLRLEVQGQ